MLGGSGINRSVVAQRVAPFHAYQVASNPAGKGNPRAPCVDLAQINHVAAVATRRDGGGADRILHDAGQIGLEEAVPGRSAGRANHRHPFPLAIVKVWLIPARGQARPRQGSRHSQPPRGGAAGVDRCATRLHVGSASLRRCRLQRNARPRKRPRAFASRPRSLAGRPWPGPNQRVASANRVSAPPCRWAVTS